MRAINAFLKIKILNSIFVCRALSVDILQAHISGVEEAFGNLTERGATEPVVKVTIALSESGFLSVKDVQAFAEIKDDSLTGRLTSVLIILCVSLFFFSQGN